MSVLIRGMEMPENCFECPCCRHDSIDGIKAEQCNLTLDVFGVNNTERWIGRGQNCPLVEVEHHNDLVDRGWVRDSINHSCWLEHNDYLEVIGIIDDAPTIIEPEGDE